MAGNILLLVAGFVMLFFGADIMIKGSSSIARKFRISDIVIGLTIVAFGTSAPELIVNIIAGFKKNGEMCFGNVIGSNMFNTLLILGIAGILMPIPVPGGTVKKEIPFSLAIILILAFLVNDRLFGRTDMLSLFDGIVLLVLFSGFIYYTVKIARIDYSEDVNIKTYPFFLSVILIIAGLGLLFAGGKSVVDSAVRIAKALGVSDKLIALTIVAGGTSLPELAASTVAAVKKRAGIAIGNIIGSNIFNLLFILGISSVINPIRYDPLLNVDLTVVAAATLLLLAAAGIRGKKLIDRAEAAVFLIAYAAYFAFLLFRK